MSAVQEVSRMADLLPPLELGEAVERARAELAQAVQEARAERERLNAAYQAEDKARAAISRAAHHGNTTEAGLSALIEARTQAERESELREATLDSACARARKVARKVTEAERAACAPYNAAARERRQRAQEEVRRREEALREAQRTLAAHLALGSDPARRAGLEVGAHARDQLAELRRIQGLPPEEAHALEAPQGLQVREAQRVVEEVERSERTRATAAAAAPSRRNVPQLAAEVEPEVPASRRAPMPPQNAATQEGRISV